MSYILYTINAEYIDIYTRNVHMIYKGILVYFYAYSHVACIADLIYICINSAELTNAYLLHRWLLMHTVLITYIVLAYDIYALYLHVYNTTTVYIYSVCYWCLYIDTICLYIRADSNFDQPELTTTIINNNS